MARKPISGSRGTIATPKVTTPPVVETDIKRKVGRPKKEALTVEQEIIALHNLIKKLASRIDAIEEMVLQVKDGQDAPATVEQTTVASNSDLGADITEIKEMLHQLLDSIGEEE